MANTTMCVSKEMWESVHRDLHLNILTLDFKYPMHKELAECLTEGMLKNPNSLAFNHLAYYLMSIVDKKYITRDTFYYLSDPKMNAKFRKEFFKFVSDVSVKYKEYVAPIVASWLVTAGGYKVCKLMLELTRVALNISIEEANSPKNNSSDEISLTDLKNKIVKDLLLWHNYSVNMEKLYNLFLQQIKSDEEKLKLKYNLLKKIVEDAKKELNESEGSTLEDILDVMKPSNFVKSWSDHINERIDNLEKRWSDSTQNTIKTAKECKSTCEELIDVHYNKSNVITFDHEKEKIDTSLFTDAKLISIMQDVVRDGVLHLPSLFRAYYAVIGNFSGLSSHNKHIFDKYSPLINQKKEALKSKLNEFKQIVKSNEEFALSLEVKENISAVNIKEEDKWIYEALQLI